MPRNRTEPNRYWSKEEKLRIVNRVLVDGLSTHQVARDEDISSGMLRNWIKSTIRILLKVVVTFRVDKNNVFRSLARLRRTQIFISLMTLSQLSI